MTNKLSNGMDSTLGNWHKLCAATFGDDAEPTKYIKRKLDEQGEDMEVIVDEGQLLMSLVAMLGKPAELDTNHTPT